MSLKIKDNFDDTLIIEATDVVENYKDVPVSIAMVHDYVSIRGLQRVQHPTNSLNDKYVPVQIQIPIRLFQKVVLPHFNNHEYSQPEHLLDNDGKANYNYVNNVVAIHQNGIKKYAVIMAGETEPTIVTEEFYNKFVKDRI